MAINRGQIHNLFQEFIVSKSEESFKSLYDASFGIVEKMVFVYIQNKQKSTELADDIFVVIYNLDRSMLPKFEEVNWLYEFVKDQCIDYLRKLIESEKKEESFDVANVYLIQEENEYTKALVDTIKYNDMVFSAKPSVKEILSLRYLGGFGIEDIALILKKKEKTVVRQLKLANRWFKISIECVAFFVIILALFFINKALGKNVTIEYIIAIVIFFVLSILSFIIYRKTKI